MVTIFNQIYTWERSIIIMQILLVFFALPLAIIIISIALQKILKCPVLVASIVFAIFLIVTFIVNNLIVLVLAIIYAIISFITALIVCFICKILNRNCDNNNCRRCRTCNNCNMCNCNNDTSNDLLTISSRCGNSNNGDILTISSNDLNGNCNDLLTISSNCNNSCNRRTQNNINPTSIDGIVTLGSNGITDDNCQCGCNNNSNNQVSARVNVIPNSSTDGRTGCICGRYRRR